MKALGLGLETSSRQAIVSPSRSCAGTAWGEGRVGVSDFSVQCFLRVSRHPVFSWLLASFHGLIGNSLLKTSRYQDVYESSNPFFSCFQSPRVFPWLRVTSPAMTPFPKWFTGRLSWRSTARSQGLLWGPTFKSLLIAKHDVLLVPFFLPSVLPGPLLCPRVWQTSSPGSDPCHPRNQTAMGSLSGSFFEPGEGEVLEEGERRQLRLSFILGLGVPAFHLPL